MNVTYYKKLPRQAKVLKKFRMFGQTFALSLTALGSKVFLHQGETVWIIFHQASIKEIFKKLPLFRQKQVPEIVRKQLFSKRFLLK